MTGTYRGYKYRIIDTGSVKFVLFFDKKGNSVDLGNDPDFWEVNEPDFADHLLLFK